MEPYWLKLQYKDIVEKKMPFPGGDGCYYMFQKGIYTFT